MVNGDRRTCVCGRGNMEPCNRESSTHCEEQGRDGSAACHMNHGQQTGEVALSGSSEEQSAKGEGQKHNEQC